MTPSQHEIAGHWQKWAESSTFIHHVYCNGSGPLPIRLVTHTPKKCFKETATYSLSTSFPTLTLLPLPPPSTHVMSSVEKLMMVGMKFSRIRILRMDFHSVVGSPINRQILSMAIFTSRGGEGRDRTSTRCCFFIPLTAVHQNKETLDSMWQNRPVCAFYSYKFKRKYTCISHRLHKEGWGTTWDLSPLLAQASPHPPAATSLLHNPVSSTAV